jgi:hypothetical protein
MEKGMKVFKAYYSDYDNRVVHWIMEGVVSDVVKDGVPFVECGGTLEPLSDKWHDRKTDAQREIHRGFVRFIGKMQAKADALADEILHAELTTEEVISGVA